MARNFTRPDLTEDAVIHSPNQYSNIYKLYLYLYYMLVVRTQIKDILKESGLGVDNISADFMVQLDEKAKQLILDAAKRAKENGRRTVMGKDV